MTNESIERFARPSTALGMAVVVISVFGWSVLMVPETRVAMTLLGAAYLAISTLGWLWAEPRGGRAIALWLGVLLVLTAVTLYITYLNAFLLAMPLIGFPAIYGGLRWGIAMTVFFLLFAIACNVHWGASAIDVYARSTGFLPGAVFVVITGLLIGRERGARAQIRRYAAQVEELATTRERNRIARDIHDSVGHYLTVVNVQIEAARAIVAKDPAASSECLVRAQDFAKEGLSELRRSVSMLRAGGVEQRPFGLALAELVEDSRARGLETALVVEGTPRPLTPAVEFTLFRAAQEAFTNVTRHASATRVDCTLRYGARDVTMRIADDGVGTASTPDGGFGLVGLRERAQLLGGSVTVTTAAGKGFTLEVSVPT
ncbi:MAG: sensor histidine kinase [Myxococcales bacterium]|nr:sensor histidine kinase [Myxococcales bacterium]